MKHTIAYEGKVGVALALMQEAYVPLFMPWVNWRIGVEGTLQRPPYSHAMGVEWVQSLDKTKGQNEVFAILSRTTKTESEERSYEYVGHMGIHRVEWPHGCGTTGSLIGAQGAQGRGLGTEAKLLILYHAFMILGLRKLTSTVKAFNAPSMAHLIKCGYKPVGRYRKHHLHEGAFVDETLFEVFRDDWEPVWQQYQDTATLPKLTDEQRRVIETELCV